ncbi:DinB family protein [Aeromicrobium sp.]|uniref:DinB family protein n=1 Tax=Aeromicrobium sp. TaxID=1871063 RepID=UPI0030C1A901
MDIEPDTKDWTWVLDEPCPECGLTSARVAPFDVAPRVEADLPRWIAALERPDAGKRPDPTTWSPAEYACHVRDVHTLFAERIRLMLDEDTPRFANWDQDETAIAEDYASQDPVTIAPQLVAASEDMVRTLRAVPADAWGRAGLRSNGSEFTVATLAQYYLHDLVHHLHDIRG